MIYKQGKIHAIADAKYKFTHGQNREYGTTRDDLYQMITYLHSIDDWQDEPRQALLLYPDFKDTESNINSKQDELSLTGGGVIKRYLLNGTDAHLTNA